MTGGGLANFPIQKRKRRFRPVQWLGPGHTASGGGAGVRAGECCVRPTPKPCFKKILYAYKIYFKQTGKGRNNTADAHVNLSLAGENPAVVAGTWLGIPEARETF